VDASSSSFVTLLRYFQRTNENKVHIFHHSISCSANVIYIIVTLHIFQHNLSNAHEYICPNHMLFHVIPKARKSSSIIQCVSNIFNSLMTSDYHQVGTPEGKSLYED